MFLLPLLYVAMYMVKYFHSNFSSTTLKNFLKPGVQFQTQNTFLWYLKNKQGDFVDRGSFSIETWTRLLVLKARYLNSS